MLSTKIGVCEKWNWWDWQSGWGGGRMNKWIKLSTLLTQPGMLSRCKVQVKRRMCFHIPSSFSAIVTGSADPLWGLCTTMCMFLQNGKEMERIWKWRNGGGTQDGEKKCCEINWEKIRRKNKHYDTPDWKKDPVGCIPDCQHQLLRMSLRVRICLKGKYWGWKQWNEAKTSPKLQKCQSPLSPLPQKRKYIYAPEWKQCDMTQNSLPHPTMSRWAILNIIGTWRGESEHKTVDLRPDPTQTGAHRDSNSSENPIPTPFFLTCRGSRICHLDGIGMRCERGGLWAGTARTGREGRARDGGGRAEREAGTAVLGLTWSQTTVSSQSLWSQPVDRSQQS